MKDVTEYATPMTTMPFPQALKRVTEGFHIRRLEWPDENEYLAIHDEQLMIYLANDKLLHPLIVSTGDIVATDWVLKKREGGH